MLPKERTVSSVQYTVPLPESCSFSTATKNNLEKEENSNPSWL